MSDSFLPIPMAERRPLLRAVAAHAMKTMPALPPAQQAEILDGLSLILGGEESEAARFAAFAIRKAEEAQMKFTSLL